MHQRQIKVQAGLFKLSLGADFSCSHRLTGELSLSYTKGHTHCVLLYSLPCITANINVAVLCQARIVRISI